MFREEVAPLKERVDQHDNRFCDVEARVQSIEDQLLKQANQGDIGQIEIPKKADEKAHENCDTWLGVQESFQEG